MNIRKFIGATSRDALRLVREALGADAVVLSNRTNDDGSVEIVALADTDFAQIAPDAGEAASHGMPAGLPAPMTNPYAASAGLQSGGAYTSPTPGVTPVNPYANGMPDVFSAVFGASPEVGAHAPDEGRPLLPDAASVAAPRSSERASFAARTAAANAPANTAPSASAAAASGVLDAAEDDVGTRRQRRVGGECVRH